MKLHFFSLIIASLVMYPTAHGSVTSSIDIDAPEETWPYTYLLIENNLDRPIKMRTPHVREEHIIAPFEHRFFMFRKDQLTPFTDHFSFWTNEKEILQIENNASTRMGVRFLFTATHIKMPSISIPTPQICPHIDHAHRQLQFIAEALRNSVNHRLQAIAEDEELSQRCSIQ